MLMNYPRHFSSMIMWLCCIVTACHTPKSPLLVGAILKIGTEIVRLATCVPHEVHWPLIQIISAAHCNMTVLWILIPSNNFWAFPWTTLLILPLIKNHIFNFTVETLLILRWKKLAADAFLLITCQIHTLSRPFLVPLLVLLLLRHLLSEAPLPFHPCTCLYWCITF